MGENEAGTLEALKALRKEVVAPEIARRKGRIVKLMGDGLLAEFSSVVDAVECAVAIQDGVTQHRDDSRPDIKLRIGINLGDVIVEGNDIYGDGVNVAARLEGLAEPGGISISATVHENILGKLDHAFVDTGEHTVKNIARPIRVWRWSAGETGIAAVPRGTASLPLPDKPSVAILPFTNMSGDPEQEYFSDGITEDLITEVSRFRELFVTARNSSFAFKDEQIDIKELGARLGVRFVVEGSVRKAGGRVRITAQLIEAATGNHVWAERYDRDLADIFDVQDEVARAIATFVAGRVRSNTVEQLRRRPTDSLNAYDLYLRAMSYTETYSKPEEFEPLLLKALELDPNFAAVHAALAITQVFRHLLSYDTSRLAAGVDYARTALDLDTNDSRSHMAMGMCLYTMGRLDEAKVYLDRSIALNPNDAWGHGANGFCLMYLGQLDEALAAIDMALRLDPYGNEWFWDGRGMILMLARRFDDAVAAYRHMSRPASWSLAYEAICLAELGRMDAARAKIDKFRQIAASRTAGNIAHDEPFKDPQVNEWIYDWLVELGLPSG
jgi:TolB-like protein/Flp pilus assembly protein TadD